MHVLDANEIFWMTFYTYDRILEEWGKIWPDALALYVKLIKQTRIQQTNQTKSLDSFLEEWLGWGYKRLKNAKDVLKWLWLIDWVEVRDTLGKIVWHYVRVNFLINEENVRTSSITYNLSTTYSEADVDESHLWPNEHKCLNNININALSTQKEKERKKEKKEKNTTSIPSVNELVTAYEKNGLLVHKIKDTQLVRERAEYKQSKKSTAYKTIGWFIQYLVDYVNLISRWEIRYDIPDRFRYALNKARDNWWKSIVRDDKTEALYQKHKKFKSLTEKQNE